MNDPYPVCTTCVRCANMGYGDGCLGCGKPSDENPIPSVGYKLGLEAGIKRATRATVKTLRDEADISERRAKENPGFRNRKFRATMLEHARLKRSLALMFEKQL